VPYHLQGGGLGDGRALWDEQGDADDTVAVLLHLGPHQTPGPLGERYLQAPRHVVLGVELVDVANLARIAEGAAAEGGAGFRGLVRVDVVAEVTADGGAVVRLAGDDRSRPVAAFGAADDPVPAALRKVEP